MSSNIIKEKIYGIFFYNPKNEKKKDNMKQKADSKIINNTEDRKPTTQTIRKIS